MDNVQFWLFLGKISERFNITEIMVIDLSDSLGRT